MKERKEPQKVTQSLFSVRGYLYFFLTISGIVTFCFLLFLNSLEIKFADVKNNSIITFVSVIFLSLLCTLVDGIRRKMTVERPVSRILNATDQFTQGDFSVRIEPLHGFDSMNEFDAIIENFNKMAEELSGVETLRTDFIANVSHELKTPLAVIQNYATMLQNPELPKEKQVDYAKIITGSTRRLSDLITNILKLNKLENQQLFPEREKYNLGEQLCECLLIYEEAWEKKGLDIDTDIDEDVFIKADQELLTLVWNNLFSNAVKFTETGGKITVSLKEENGYANVTVSDTGCGMTPDVGQHIFEKFYQGDKSHATGGNGLGLALVKSVIDIMSGEISVDSTPGTGSTFLVKLEGENFE